jgi:hypothetical protein
MISFWQNVRSSFEFSRRPLKTGRDSFVRALSEMARTRLLTATSRRARRRLFTFI